ncbi:MAG: insulinase family protein [Saprospiraceae bacterium]|nr:insulinase family protein [Saprospiraceae bacterium]
MKNILFSIISLSLLLAACSPKTSDKTSGKELTPITPNDPAVSKAPKIPLPVGDVRKNAPTPGTAPKVQIGSAETFKLDNGLTVILVENRKLPKVSYRVFVDYDPVLEKDAAGYLDMTGELLSKGTKTRSKTQIDEQIDLLGASFFSDANGVNGTCLSKHSDKLLDILSDVLLNPVFPQEELDKSKKRAESGLAAQKNDGNAIAGLVANILRYGKDHPYGEIMTDATLAKINLEQIKNHYNTYFKPNIAYLVVTGDVTKAQVEKQARQFFGNWAKSEVPTHQYGIPRAPEKNQVDFVHKPGAVQSVINITYPIELQPGTSDVIRSRVANTLLGGYFNSRLNNNLREGHGWTYGSGSALNPDKLVGFFNASASVRNTVTDSSIIEALKEMRRLGVEKVENEELQVVKNVMAGNFARSLEEPGTVATFALNTARYKLPADYYEKYLEVLQSVSAEEVQAMAQKYIRADRAYILVVGNKDEVAERVKQFSADGKINFYDAYGNPVKSANTTLPQGLTAEQVLEDYLNAIGGRAKINTIKDMQSTSTMQLQGMAFGIKTYQKDRNKYAVEMSMNGQPMNKQSFDGINGAQSANGQVEPLEGEQLNDFKEQALFCKEAAYKSNGYKFELKGIEVINGNNAYVLEVIRPDGKKITEFYDTKTSLKVREISAGKGMDGNPSTQIIDMMDYKEVSGVKLPHGMTVSGAFPVPFKVAVTEIKLNTGIADAVFKL